MVIQGPFQAIYREQAGLQGPHTEANLDGV